MEKKIKIEAIIGNNGIEKVRVEYDGEEFHINDSKFSQKLIELMKDMVEVIRM